MAVHLNFIKAGAYRLTEETAVEHVRISVALVQDVHDALAHIVDQDLIADVYLHTLCGTALQRLGHVLDHVRAQRRQEEGKAEIIWWSEEGRV